MPICCAAGWRGTPHRRSLATLSVMTSVYHMARVAARTPVICAAVMTVAPPVIVTGLHVGTARPAAV